MALHGNHLMMKPDFADARIKLPRERKHIADVEAAISSFLKEDFYHLRLEKRHEFNELILDSLHQPNKDINALVGDAISNLRSVLDYVAVAIVSPVTGNSESIGFPFADNAKGFAGEVTKRSIGLFASTLVDHFIDEVQAYRGGKGETYWILNKLRNIDKHRLLISTVNIAGVYITAKMGGMMMEDCFFGSTEGQSTNMILFPAGLVIDFAYKPRPAFEVRLSEPPFIERTPVVDFLNKAARDIENLLSALSSI